MKNLLKLIVLVVFMSVGTIAYGKSPIVTINSEILIEISRSQVPDDVFIEDFYMERIPDEYNEAFIYYTRDCPEIRMNFYSIMLVESGGFKYFKNVNKNGSVDMGPSQLNSTNLKNKNFVKAFRPTDESRITSVYCFYMVMTIGYYKDLYDRLGDEYAFYAYNGGDKAAKLIKNNNRESKNRTLINNVTRYDKAVRKRIQQETAALLDYIKVRRVQHVMEVYESLKEKFDYYRIESLKDTLTVDTMDGFQELVFDRTTYFFRRKDLFYLKNEELGIVVYPEIGTLYNEL